LLAVIDEKQSAIANGVNKELQNYKSEIERLQKQEMQLNGSIDKLEQEWNELDNSVGIRHDHINARKAYKDLIEQAAIKANLLFDDDFTEEDKDAWSVLMKDTFAMATTFESLLNKTR